MRQAQERTVKNLELYGWFTSLTEGAQDLVLRLLASLPGGESLEDAGFEPFAIGWKEFSMIGEMCDKINDQGDVEEVIRHLVPELFEPENEPGEDDALDGRR